VALLAGLGESAGHVVGVVRGLEVFQVARNAIGGSAFELVVNVALVALQGRMRSDQGEASELQVVEIGAQPVVHAMALLAGGGEAGGQVRRSVGLLKIFGMA
jgi:hypothetical protein